jgi:hypothetical protein
MESAVAVRANGRDFALWVRTNWSIFFYKISNGIEGAALDVALGDEGEEAFDLVEPRGIGRREVKMPTRMAREPSSDLGMLMGGVAVDDEMDVELVGRRDP